MFLKIAELFEAWVSQKNQQVAWSHCWTGKFYASCQVSFAVIEVVQMNRFYNMCEQIYRLSRMYYMH